jgi:hypothetical protein
MALASHLAVLPERQFVAGAPGGATVDVAAGMILG